jgi:hypothetical protein
LGPISSDPSVGFPQQAMLRSQNIHTNIMSSTAEVQGVNNGIPLTRGFQPEISEISTQRYDCYHLLLTCCVTLKTSKMVQKMRNSIRCRTGDVRERAAFFENPSLDI